MVRTWLTLGLLCAALAGCAGALPDAPGLAGPIATNARSVFTTFDADHDGRLAPVEGARVGLLDAAFTAADGDGDGAVSLSEFLAPGRLRELEGIFRGITDRWVESTDANGDGRLTRAEYEGAMLVPRPGSAAQAVQGDVPAAAFAAADGDADGALVPGEALSLVGWLLERGWRLAPRGAAF